MDANLPTGSSDKHGESMEVGARKKKRKSPAIPWKKPLDMPRRPLSAYNLFFQSERRRLLGEWEGATAGQIESISPEGEKVKYSNKKNAKIGFADLAKAVAARWKTLQDEERATFEEKAAQDKQRYDIAVAAWRAKHKEAKSQSADSTATLFHGKPDDGMSVAFGMDLFKEPQSQIDDSHACEAAVGLEVDTRHFPLLDAAAAPVLGIDSLKTFPTTRPCTSSGSLWTSLSSFEPQDLLTPLERSSLQWDHTSTTADSSGFIDALEASMSTGSHASPWNHQAERIEMESENFGDERSIVNFGVSPISEYAIPNYQSRIYRSASFPFVPLEATQTPPTLLRPMGQCHSHPVGRRSVAGRSAYNPFMATSNSARRAAIFLEALPPPPFRLHQAANTVGAGDETALPGHHHLAELHHTHHNMARDVDARETSVRRGSHNPPLSNGI